MSHILLLFSKPDAYINHNATQPLSDITGGTLSDYKQLPLEPQKGFILLFFTNAQVLPKTSKHKFMCKNGEDNSFPTYTLVTQETEYLWGYLWVNSCVYKYFWLSLYPLIYGWSLHDSATVLTHTHAHTPRVCLHKSTVILHTVSQKDHINRSLIALISNS